MQTFWLIPGILIVAIAATWAWFHRRRETRTLKELARKHRLNYATEDLIGIHERYQNLELIRQGHSRHVSHTIFGSTERGMITLFYYTYDLGFDTDRITRKWWMAVLETDNQHDHWRVQPAKMMKSAENTQKIDRFILHADHQKTIDLLTRAGMEEVLKSAHENFHFEADGPLLAVAVADCNEIEIIDQLLATVINLSQRLSSNNSTN